MTQVIDTHHTILVSPPIAEGLSVICLRPSIDQKLGQGEVGVVQGFARLSSYHSREAFVAFADGKSGWFWVHDLIAADGRADKHAEVAQ